MIYYQANFKNIFFRLGHHKYVFDFTYGRGIVLMADRNRKDARDQQEQRNDRDQRNDRQDQRNDQNRDEKRNDAKDRK